MLTKKSTAPKLLHTKPRTKAAYALGIDRDSPKPGKRIRELRMRAALSQDELAERVGVSRVAVTRWEQGQAKPHITHIRTMRQIFSDPAETSNADSEAAAMPGYLALDPNAMQRIQSDPFHQAHLRVIDLRVYLGRVMADPSSKLEPSLRSNAESAISALQDAELQLSEIFDNRLLALGSAEGDAGEGEGAQS